MSKENKRKPRKGKKAKEEKPIPLKKSKAKGEYEPDPSRACDFKWKVETPESTPENRKYEVVFCNAQSDYRVKFYTEKRYLVPGGDGSKASDYQRLVEQEYLCEKHMDEKYKKLPPPTPIITFVRIKRQPEEEKEE